MADIPLTTFVEFSVTSGPARVGCVSDSKQDYDPRRDFYKGLRERTVKQFREGWDAGAFRRSLQSVGNPRKRPSYEECRKGLTHWARGHTITARSRHSATWGGAGVDVKVNPELRLLIDGDDYVIKLYFKAQPLTQARLTNTLHLLASTAPKKSTAAILDTRRGTLHPAPAPDLTLEALLRSDAAAFATLLAASL